MSLPFIISVLTGTTSGEVGGGTSPDFSGLDFSPTDFNTTS